MSFDGSRSAKVVLDISAPQRIWATYAAIKQKPDDARPRDFAGLPMGLAPGCLPSFMAAHCALSELGPRLTGPPPEKGQNRAFSPHFQ